MSSIIMQSLTFMTFMVSEKIATFFFFFFFTHPDTQLAQNRLITSLKYSSECNTTYLLCMCKFAMPDTQPAGLTLIITIILNKVL